jgi:hypothetical protein
MGYTKDEPLTITFGGLKQAQNEAFQDGINFAASQIAYYLKDEITISKIISFLHVISNTELYSTDDEDDEDCNCVENCGADDCGASCDCEDDE